MSYLIETQHWEGDDRVQMNHCFDSPEAAHEFLSTRISYGYKRTWINGSELEGQKTPTLEELQVLFDKPECRVISTNPATHVQIEANRPVVVRSGDAVQFIEE